MRTVIGLLFVTMLAASASAQPAEARAFDITAVTLDVRPAIAIGRLSLTATLDIRNSAGNAEFEFFLADWYDSATVTAASGAAIVTRPGNGTIRVRVSRPATTERLVFALSGTPASTSERRSVLSSTTVFLLWSDRFYPTDFDDWTLFRATIELPASFVVNGPGRVTARRSRSGRRTWTIDCSQPIRVASILADTRWIETASTRNGRHIRTLLYPHVQRYADSIATTSADVLGVYEGLFGPYPFDTYTFASVDSIFARRAIAGGVIYEPSYLRQEMDSTGHDAHETALLWWGLTSAGRGPGSYQWTEGFGDYAEFMYDEVRGKPIPPDFFRYRRGYLRIAGTADEPTYTNPRGPLSGNFVHGRLPFLMHLLRFAIGDSAFRRGLRLLFDRYRFRTYTVSEFVATMSDAAGQSVDWWKTEWLDRKGVPELIWSSDNQTDTSGTTVTVVVDQLGSVYHVPIEFGVRTPNGLTLHRVMLSDSHNSFVIRTDTPAADIVFDPRQCLLARVTRR